MKSLRKLLYIIPLTGMMVTSCMDVENIEIDHIGGYALEIQSSRSFRMVFQLGACWSLSKRISLCYAR